MDSFALAERYIQLRSYFTPTSLAKRLKQINDMIVMPVIVLFLWFVGSGDGFFVISCWMTAYTQWAKYNEYMVLSFKMQRMRLQMYAAGGPKIVTNDSTYMPYVWADAVTRTQPEYRLGLPRSQPRPKSHSRPPQ
jgi:hypothetical protein